MGYKIIIDGLANGKIQWNISFSSGQGKGDPDEGEIIGVVKEFVNNLEVLRGMRQDTE